MSLWEVWPTDDGPWEIYRDGVVVETVRAHYDAWEVLARAACLAGQDLAWRLADSGSFQAEAVTSGGAR